MVPGGLDGAREDRRIPCLHWIVERLARRHSVEVFALRQTGQPPCFEFAGAKVHALDGHSVWVVVRKIWSAHRRRRFDVVHAFWASTPGAVALVAARLIRRPVYVHVAGGELVSMPDIAYGSCRTRKGRFVVRTVLRRVDGVTVASSGMFRHVERLGVTPVSTPLGVDLQRWPLQQPQPIADAPYRLIHVASINRVKNQTLLLRAAARLKGTDFPFHLDMVGVDTLDGELHQLASRLQLSDFVTFHGWLPQTEVRVLMMAAHLHVVTSHHEAGPLVAREAASCGVATIGSPVGHIADWAPEGAVAVESDDDVKFASEIRKILRDDERRVAVASAAQAEVAKHDADWTVSRFEAMYNGRLGD